MQNKINKIFKNKLLPLLNRKKNKNKKVKKTKNKNNFQNNFTVTKIIVNNKQKNHTKKILYKKNKKINNKIYLYKLK